MTGACHVAQAWQSHGPSQQASQQPAQQPYVMQSAKGWQLSEAVCHGVMHGLWNVGPGWLIQRRWDGSGFAPPAHAGDGLPDGRNCSQHWCHSKAWLGETMIKFLNNTVPALMPGVLTGAAVRVS